MKNHLIIWVHNKNNNIKKEKKKKKENLYWSISWILLVRFLRVKKFGRITDRSGLRLRLGGWENCWWILETQRGTEDRDLLDFKNREAQTNLFLIFIVRISCSVLFLLEINLLPMALSSFSSSTPSMEYDVFLSFRGEDTRNCFTSHLYSALRGKGIAIFNDDEVLERGEQISSELFQAIHHSRIAIVVFTENYASSSWCLDELVSILECGMKPGKYIIPIFYTVDPGVVRHQSGTYATAFAEHEKNYPQDKIDKWRFGLSRVANFSGWHLDHGYCFSLPFFLFLPLKIWKSIIFHFLFTKYYILK